MFTGIITDVGRVHAREVRGDTRLTVATGYDVAGIAIGASIACSGACLTVVETGTEADGTGWFAVDVSAETLAATTLGDWDVGTRVNLERSLRLGDELGGHIVSGHIDGLARVVEVTPEGDSERWLFALPPTFGPFVAAKGSIALDGVSLTVNHVEPGAAATDETLFGVNIIPHTRAHTTFADRRRGDRLNFEIDMLARYVARLTGQDQPAVLRNRAAAQAGAAA